MAYVVLFLKINPLNFLCILSFSVVLWNSEFYVFTVASECIIEHLYTPKRAY